MEIVIFAEQFRNGNWEVWKHPCGPAEIEAIVGTALVQAKTRASHGQPIPSDFLAGARRTFNVAVGSADNPCEGDTRVYCACVDKIVIGVYEKIRKYSQTASQTQEFVKMAPSERVDAESGAAAASFA